MGNKKNRIDTSALFETMAVKTNFLNEETKSEDAPKEEPVSQEVSAKASSEKPKGRKPLKEKNIQVSVYLRPEQAKELRIQNALKEKETDKSALARTGIDIALQMSSQCYNKLKQQAEERKLLPGELVEKALQEYFEKK